MGFFFGERSSCEPDTVAVEEVLGHVGRLVGYAGVLGIAGDVDASEGDLAAVGVSKLAVFDNQSKAGAGHFCFFKSRGPKAAEGYG